jgi:hypothetical protein
MLSCFSLLEQRLEAKHQVFDKINELPQRWKQRIWPCKIRLADRVLNFNLNILLNVRLNSGESGVFCFHQVCAIEPIGSEKKIVGNGKQGTVLIDVVKLVHSPESIVPTLVWFEPVDSFFGLGPHSVYFSSLHGFVLGHTLSNGKADLSADRASGEVRRAYKNELLREMIQCGSDIVNEVSGDSNDIKRERWDSLEVRVSHESNGMWRDTLLWVSMDYCRVCKGKNFGGKITEVLFGPFNLYLNENEAILSV